MPTIPAATQPTYYPPKAEDGRGAAHNSIASTLVETHNWSLTPLASYSPRTLCTTPASVYAPQTATRPNDINFNHIVGEGGESVVYGSLDRTSVYKRMTTGGRASIPQFATDECYYLNRCHGENFSELIIHDGDCYIRMPFIDGKPLSQLTAHDCPEGLEGKLRAAIDNMELKGIYHSDLQLQNFMYSSKDGKIHAIDILSIPESIPRDSQLFASQICTYKRAKEEILIAASNLEQGIVLQT